MKIAGCENNVATQKRLLNAAFIRPHVRSSKLANVQLLNRGLAAVSCEKVVERAVLVSDPALAGSDVLSTVRVLSAALRRLEYDLVLAGADTSDGGAGVVAAGIAFNAGLPYLSYASRIEPQGDRVLVHRLSPVGYDVIESALPALVVATQALGEPRYPSLKGIMAARSKEIVTWSLADLDLGDAPVGGAVATTEVVSARPPATRAATRVVREPAPVAAAQVVEFLAERRLI